MWTYGPGVPSRWRRWTPTWRRRMREILTEHLAVATEAGARPAVLDSLRDELRGYGG